MHIGFLLKWIEPKQVLPKEQQRFSNRELFALILPILVEQLLTMLVGIADTLMVSYAGEAAVSGVSLVNRIMYLFLCLARWHPAGLWWQASILEEATKRTV